MNSRPSVLVLMSTYRGERFLREQLDSILSQEDVDVTLLVRDDGSKDSTGAILSEYAAKDSRVSWMAAANVGFVKSFSELMWMGWDYNPRPDFYAFADQDDIWFPKKLITACRALSAADVSKPCLFTSNSMQVDAEGHELELFHPGPSPKYRKGNVLVFGTEQGCSMVFNRKAVEIYVNNEPQLNWHDRWLYHICYFLGETVYSHEPLFYYRRHEHNALANSHAAGGLAGEKRKIVRVFRILFTEPPMTNHVEMAHEFYERFGSLLNNEDQRIFRRFIVCRTNLLSKIYMIFSHHFIYPFSDPNERRLLKWLILAGRL